MDRIDAYAVPLPETLYVCVDVFIGIAKRAESHQLMRIKVTADDLFRVTVRVGPQRHHGPCQISQAAQVEVRDL